ncbi:MAG: thioredoxin family protein [Candidatus Paceibacterota bacterium]|jgi:thiol-disulfide isomerase/thioredoxin
MIKKSLNGNRFEVALAAIIAIVSIFSLLTVFESDKALNGMLTKYQEKNRPANLDIVLIKDNNCPYCYDAAELISEIETENVNMVSRHVLDYRSNEAKEIIMKYRIEKVPAVIIKGEIDKVGNLYNKFKDIGEIMDDVFIFRDAMMPYVDIKSGKSVGNVKVVLMTADGCADCYNYDKYIAELKILGIPTSNREIIDYKSNSGQVMVKANAIENVPTFILTGDLGRYPALKKIQDYDDNIFVLRNVIKPYLNIGDGKVYTKTDQ